MDPKPTLTTQDIITEGIGTYLSNAEIEGLDDKAKASEWSAKHLISCLRKRTSEIPECYVLKQQEIVGQVPRTSTHLDLI